MIEEKKILELIDSDRFSELFIDELGWNRPVAQQIEFSIGAERFSLIPVASYKGIQVWSCNQIPNLRIQRAIDKEIAKISAERLTIFTISNCRTGDGPCLENLLEMELFVL